MMTTEKDNKISELELEVERLKLGVSGCEREYSSALSKLHSIEMLADELRVTPMTRFIAEELVRRLTAK